MAAVCAHCRLLGHLLGVLWIADVAELSSIVPSVAHGWTRDAAINQTDVCAKVMELVRGLVLP